MGFVGDASHFPLVITSIGGALSTDDVVTMRTFYRDVHGRNTRFIHLVDARTASRPDAVVRHELGELTKEMLELSRQYQVANAIVLSGPVLAGVLKAIRWVVPSPTPERNFGAVGEAQSWLWEAARTEGIALTATAAAAVRRLAELPGVPA